MSRPAYQTDALAIGVGVGAFGLTFGVLAATAGLSVPQAQAMSVLVFTGASQFAAVGVIETGGAVGAALSGALLLAARNTMYGIALADLLFPRERGRPGTARRLLSAQFVIDETTAVATAQSTRADGRRAFYLTAVSVFVFWNAGTFFGALGGSALADPATLGLDAAFPAGFIALLMPQVRSRAGQVAAVSGAALALVAVPLVPLGAPILVAGLGIIPGLLVARRSEARAPGADR